MSKGIGKFVARTVAKGTADLFTGGASSAFDAAANYGAKYGIGKISDRVYDKFVPDTYGYYCNKCGIEWTEGANIEQVINAYFEEKNDALWGHFGLAIMPVILAYVGPLILVPLLMLCTFSFPDAYWTWFVGYFIWSWKYVLGYAALVVLYALCCSYSLGKDQEQCLRKNGIKSISNNPSDTACGCVMALFMLLIVCGIVWWFMS